MKLHTRCIRLVILAILLLVALSACDSDKQVPAPPDMEGIWAGLGYVQLSNQYLNQRQVSVMLDIDSLGVVYGAIGDAYFQKVRLRGPNWLSRLFGNKKYFVTVSLQDPIVKYENFRRPGGTLTIEKAKNKELLCTFTSTGSETDKANPVLVVTDIKCSLKITR